MDDIWKRFPHIFGTVLGFLDDKSIANSRLVNKTWKDSIENDKTIWNRIISKKLIHEENSDSWKHVLDKIPFDHVKEIGKGVLEFLIDIDKDKMIH